MDLPSFWLEVKNLMKLIKLVELVKQSLIRT